MEPRSQVASRAETTRLVLPGHTNVHGTIFGGIVMQWIDEIAAASAVRHARGAVVTAAVDALQFLAPIYLGDMVVLKAQVNRSGNTSMEVGVRVEVEDPQTGQRRKTTRAFLTFVAVDGSGRPRPIAALLLDDQDGPRRHQAALDRHAARLRTRNAGC